MERTTAETIRFIRENLKYSQAYVAEDIMSQSAYSKAERGEIELSFSKIYQVIKKFGMTLDEFHYLKNDYYVQDDDGLQGIKNINYTSENSLLKLKHELEKIENPSFRTKEYLLICEALLLIHRESNYQEAQKIVAPIWDRLEKHDTWFLTDIYLINNILFLLSMESAVSVTELAIAQLEKYKGLRNVQHLRGNLQLNLLALFLERQVYVEGLEVADQFILEFKRKKLFMHLAIAYARKGILLNRLAMPGEQECYDTCFTILSFVDYQQLEEEIRKEIKEYT